MPTSSETNRAKSVFLYALSTCAMCKTVKKLLTNLSVPYDFVDVDLLEGNEKETVIQEMLKWDRRRPFPMLIINNATCIVGDEPEAIRQALGK
jgi:glutaredoxin-like protein NrdH